ncbi:hypothetical protein RF11_10993 [Thelohanellus kitauei]|uniref:Uncharacterized protein n=1 Tax=Thelohanellus kitauei TaxID=669202 RepID=A0A0C2M1X4_THEKT|nr:hypothetical protein RF11_10993 [Thelohanellus kitauei]
MGVLTEYKFYFRELPGAIVIQNNMKQRTGRRHTYNAEWENFFPIKAVESDKYSYYCVPPRRELRSSSTSTTNFRKRRWTVENTTKVTVPANHPKLKETPKLQNKEVLDDNEINLKDNIIVDDGNVMVSQETCHYKPEVDLNVELGINLNFGRHLNGNRIIEDKKHGKF